MRTSLVVVGIALLMVSCATSPYSGEEQFAGKTGLYSHYTSGVIRPEQGTVELLLDMEKPMEQFGDTWDFLFGMKPAQAIGKNAKTLVGVYVLPEPEKGLRAIFRDAKETRTLAFESFSYVPRTKLLVAFSWGKRLRLFVDGKMVAENDKSYAIPDELMPYLFTVDKKDHFKTEALRVSSKELEENELAHDPVAGFKTTPDTTLLATGNLATTELFRSAWHGETAFSGVKPVFWEKYSCITEAEDPVYPLLAINYGTVPKSWTVSLCVTDIKGQNVLESKTEVVASPGGMYEIKAIPLPLLRKKGFYTVRAEIADGAGKTQRFVNHYAVFPAVDQTLRDGKLASYYGQHFEGTYDLDVFRKIHIKTLRAGGTNPFIWSHVEPAKGRFDFSQADAFVADAQANGIEVLGILGYAPRWASVEPDENVKKAGATRYTSWKPRSVEEWGNYVHETVGRYQGRVRYWEIWNEIDWHPPAPPYSYTGTTEEYLALLREAYRQAKRADPDCEVLISGFGMFGDKKMPLELLEKGAADSFDIFNFHAYIGVSAVDPLKDALAKVKPGAPIWNTEQMWHEMEPGEKRNYLSAAAPLWFLEKGLARYLNMGMLEYFFDANTRSPAVEYYVTGILQDFLRPCDSLEGKCSFVGDADYSVRDSLKRTDGSFLTILGSELAEHDVEVDNANVIAEDLYGGTILIKVADGHSTLSVKNLAYIVTREPLRVVKSVATTECPLFVNGGFEEVGGDIAMGGLEAGKPLGWTFRDTAKDPAGRISLTRSARSGNYGLLMASSGKGDVYAFRDVRVPAPGVYTVAGHFKNAAPGKKPRAFVKFFDRGVGTIVESQPKDLSEDKFDLFTLNVEFKEVPSQPCALLFGVTGEGGVALDDIYFGKGTTVPQSIAGQKAAKSDAKAGAGTEYDGVVIPEDVNDGSKPAMLPAKVAVDETRRIKEGGSLLLGCAYAGPAMDNQFMDESKTRVSEEMRAILAKVVPLPLNRLAHYNGFRWKHAVGPLEARIPGKFESWDKNAVNACGPAELIGAIRTADPSARFIWTVNLESDTPEDAADLAEFLTGDGSVNHNGGTDWAKLRIESGLREPVPVVTWELGNEVEWRDSAKRMPLADYIERCRKIISAIRAVQPTATFAPHAATAPWAYKERFNEDWRDWHRTILRELGNDISYLAFHPYYYGYPTSLIEEYLNVIRDDINQITGGDRVKIYISEHGLWPGQLKGQPWEKTWHTTHALMGCLATAQFSNRLYARPDIGLATYHCFSAGPWGMVYRGKQTKKLYTTGIADMFRLYNAAVGGHVLASTVSGDWTDPTKGDLSLTVTAMETKDGVNLIIVNREPSTKRLISFSFKGSYDLVRSACLTAPAMQSYNDEHEKRVVLSESSEVVKDFSSYEMPAKSVVTLYLKKNKE